MTTPSSIVGWERAENRRRRSLRAEKTNHRFLLLGRKIGAVDAVDAPNAAAGVVVGQHLAEGAQRKQGIVRRRARRCGVHAQIDCRYRFVLDASPYHGAACDNVVEITRSSLAEKDGEVAACIRPDAPERHAVRGALLDLEQECFRVVHGGLPAGEVNLPEFSFCARSLCAVLVSPNDYAIACAFPRTTTDIA